MAFNFKQFNVTDDRSSMKVGTDAVLLGAWASVNNVSTILDIGTGCGVIALMLAQRSNTLIDAVDIDKESADEASENVYHSKWVERILVHNISMQKYIKTNDKTYDLIVANPPYFVNSLKSEDQSRNISRHTDSLPFEELAFGVKTLLNKKGKFCVILPEKESIMFNNIALIHKLYCTKRTLVLPKPNRNCIRVLSEYKLTKLKSTEDTIILRNSDSTYNESYINLTKDFYLHF